METRRFPLERDPLEAGIGVRLRVRGQEAKRVRMARRGEYRLRGSFLDKVAEIHDAHAVSDVAHHIEIVGGRSPVPSPQPAAQIVEEVQDLALHGDVEPGGRLVGE